MSGVSSTPTHAQPGGPVSSPAHLATQPSPGVVPIASLTPQASSGGSSGSATMSAASNQHSAVHTRNGEAIYGQMEKINSELLAMTYGALVTQLIRDYKDVKTVNVELEKMGYNIGVRLVDDFLAKSNLQSCVNFRETAQVIAKVGFKMFLGITADGQSQRARAAQTRLLLVITGSLPVRPLY